MDQRSTNERKRLYGLLKPVKRLTAISAAESAASCGPRESPHGPPAGRACYSPAPPASTKPASADASRLPAPLRSACPNRTEAAEPSGRPQSHPRSRSPLARPDSGTGSQQRTPKGVLTELLKPRRPDTWTARHREKLRRDAMRLAIDRRHPPIVIVGTLPRDLLQRIARHIGRAGVRHLTKLAGSIRPQLAQQLRRVNDIPVALLQIALVGKS